MSMCQFHYLKKNIGKHSVHICFGINKFAGFSSLVNLDYMPSLED